MKKLKLATCIMVLACFAIFLFSNAFVKAQWIYSGSAPSNLNLGLDITVFQWEGSEELPEDTEDGENHRALVKRITESDYGLNNASSFLSEYIEDRIYDSKDTVSSVAPTPGGNLKDLFNTAEMQALDFMIFLHLDGDKNIIDIELYTFETALVGNKIGTEVSPVYQTHLELTDGKWLPTKTTVGKSVSMRYDAKQGGTRITIDPNAWSAGVANA